MSPRTWSPQPRTGRRTRRPRAWWTRYSKRSAIPGSGGPISPTWRPPSTACTAGNPTGSSGSKEKRHFPPSTKRSRRSRARRSTRFCPRTTTPSGSRRRGNGFQRRHPSSRARERAFDLAVSIGVLREIEAVRTGRVRPAHARLGLRRDRRRSSIGWGCSSAPETEAGSRPCSTDSSPRSPTTNEIAGCSPTTGAWRGPESPSPCLLCPRAGARSSRGKPGRVCPRCAPGFGCSETWSGIHRPRPHPTERLSTKPPSSTR